MNGTVVNLPVQVGQTLISVQITPIILTLADLDTITVRTKVPEADIQAIKVGPGRRASPRFPVEGKRYEGKVRVIQPVPERAGNAVFYNVLFEVDNRERTLFSDMTVQVDIETGAARQVLAMPVVALGERGKDGRFTVTGARRRQQADAAPGQGRLAGRRQGAGAGRPEGRREGAAGAAECGGCGGVGCERGEQLTWVSLIWRPQPSPIAVRAEVFLFPPLSPPRSADS